MSVQNGRLKNTILTAVKKVLTGVKLYLTAVKLHLTDVSHTKVYNKQR